jgi:hypothetical protein
MDTPSKHPIAHLQVCTHSTAVHSMGLSSEQAGVVSHGVEVVGESSVAGEGFVDGGKKESGSMGPSTQLKGIGHF